MELQAPGFGSAQPWLLRAVGGIPSPLCSNKVFFKKRCLFWCRNVLTHVPHPDTHTVLHEQGEPRAGEPGSLARRLPLPTAAPCGSKSSDLRRPPWSPSCGHGHLGFKGNSGGRCLRRLPATVVHSKPWPALLRTPGTCWVTLPWSQGKAWPHTSHCQGAGTIPSTLENHRQGSMGRQAAGGPGSPAILPTVLSRHLGPGCHLWG